MALDHVSRRALAALLVLTLLLAGLPAGLRPATAATRAQPSPAGEPEPQPLTSHPRLWITAEDLPRLRSWATDANPFWVDGLAVLAEERTAQMDDGTVPGEDDGSRYWQQYPTESYAELFAFLSLIHPDEATRQDYAQRARTLLMHAMNEAAKGPAEEAPPFRDPNFVAPHSDRARWWGEGWALTVDWIYPTLTAEDKATIRTVFLRWCEEIVTGGYNHPEPIGLTNDPALFANRSAFRWSGNNYFTSHMRNLGLMALALDPTDDPGGELGAYLEIAIGAHLYMTDHLLRTDAAGGMAPEGFEYSPQALAYVAQFLLALRTAGQADSARWGPQVVLTDNPFWDEIIPGFLHSLSPRPTLVPGSEYIGPVYQPAWYGDGLVYWAIDHIEVFGPLGLYDGLTGNADRLEAIRWIQTHTPPGGAELLLAERVADPNAHLDAILYFLIFDPAAPAPADPHPNVPLAHFAPGIGRLLARTGWGADAAWFTYGLGWIAIDHQFGDGNGFAFYRDGEWLTKGLVGYGGVSGNEDPADDYHFPSSENQNTLALENDPPGRGADDPTDYRNQLWRSGSQWEYTPAGDPTILAMSVAPGYAYALGDATNLYNSTYEGVSDVLHASRSIVWLAPDTIVVYDRAASQTDGRFKRFWLNLPADAAVDGTRTTMTTASGQQLAITTLLPTDATPEVWPLDIAEDVLAVGEPMRYQFVVEAPGGPREARFFHVLHGADAGAQPSPVVAIASEDGTFAGTVVGTTAVLFPVNLGTEVGEVRYTVPAETTTHVITGLTPGGGYNVVTTATDEGIAVAVTAGTADRADEGGVLLVGDLPEVLDAPPFAFTNAPVSATPATTPEATDDEADATAATAEPESGSIAPEASPAVEGGAAAAGSGQIVYKLYDGPTAPGHLFRVAANQGATPEDLSLALDTLGPTAPDQWVNASPDGEWLLLGTERFDPECAGWACLAVVPADLSAAEVVRVDGAVVHAERFATIAGDVVVFPAGEGPHETDLWATRRQDEGWAAPLLLTEDSPYAYQANPAIAADGARVVFECGDLPYGEEGTALCEVAPDGSGFRVVLTPADAPPGLAAGGALRQPDYAPDGSVVFAAVWDGTIWRLPPGASVPEPVGPAFTNDNAPCVLADGRVVSIWLGRPGNTGLHEAKVMTPDGTSFAMLASAVDVEGIGCGG